MTISFNVQHSPMGAFASFTIGHFDTRGGMASESGKPAGSNVYLGYLREGDEEARLLPFYEEPGETRGNFEVGSNLAVHPPGARIPAAAITRTLSPASDEWRTGPFTARVISPFFPIPDPRTASEDELRRASCPAVFVELDVDNRQGDRSLRAIFGIEDEPFRDLGDAGRLGAAIRDRRGFACRRGVGAASFSEFELREGLKQAGKRMFGLGRTAGLTFDVPAGQRRSFVVALAFYNAGIVTTGIKASYAYTRYFEGLEAVLDYALDNFEFYRDEALERARELERSALDDEQRFLVSQAIHSYFGSTAWFDVDGAPLWVVNEGEYVMMNTLDLTIDQAFFELRYFPWAVRTELEIFAERYSYRDEVHRPGAPADRLPGGVAFCHDHGVANQFSPPGHSSYELAELPAVCFSYMSCEQVTNWVLTAGLYIAKTSDDAFLRRWQDLLRSCYESLLNRDDPDPARRTGIMGCDGARTGSGAEITTYDSLDASLGQARSNLYLAGKIWASHVALEDLFGRLGWTELASQAGASAELSAATIATHWSDTLGYIPAVFEGGNTSAILPAIEALVYPKQMGLERTFDPQGRFAGLLDVLRRHFLAVFKPGVCQFPDGGWKLSSTSDNSWMSKIAIAQYVARSILGVRFSPEEQRRHDSAHATWQRVGSGYWACSDQMVSGVARGSRYYPRVVTSILWLDE